MVGIQSFILSCHFSEYKSVNQYHEPTASVFVFHHFPSQGPHTAQVDISQLLDTIDRQNLQIGAWLNIIGYITPSASKSRSKVQAITLWSAGAINLQQYETALVLRRMT